MDLQELEAIAERELLKHGLHDWSFGWARTKRRQGACNYPSTEHVKRRRKFDRAADSFQRLWHKFQSHPCFTAAERALQSASNVWREAKSWIEIRMTEHDEAGVGQFLARFDSAFYKSGANSLSLMAWMHG